MVESFDLPDEDFFLSPELRANFAYSIASSSDSSLGTRVALSRAQRKRKGGTGYEKALERGRCSRWIGASLWSRFGTMGWRSRWAVWRHGTGDDGRSRLDGWRASVRGLHGSSKRNHRREGQGTRNGVRGQIS